MKTGTGTAKLQAMKLEDCTRKRLEGCTKAELLAHAKSWGVKTFASMKKDKIVEVLLQAKRISKKRKTTKGGDDPPEPFENEDIQAIKNFFNDKLRYNTDIAWNLIDDDIEDVFDDIWYPSESIDAFIDRFSETFIDGASSTFTTLQ